MDQENLTKLRREGWLGFDEAYPHLASKLSIYLNDQFLNHQITPRTTTAIKHFVIDFIRREEDDQTHEFLIVQGTENQLMILARKYNGNHDKIHRV